LRLKFHQLLTLLSIALLWELVSRFRIAPPYLLPPPTTVLCTLYGLIVDGVLVREFMRTLARVVIGFSIGSIAGVLLGVAISLSRVLRESIYPLIAFIAVMPTVALIPLLIIWVGVNEALPIVTVFLCSFTPVLYTTITGIRLVDREVIGVARTLGASTSQIVFRVLIPQALPSILSSLKVEAVMAWKTCFVAEMVAMSSGLGYLMMIAQSLLRVDILLSALVVLALACYSFQQLFEWVELRILGRWGMESG